MAQKAHPNPHPACVETQSVSRFVSGIKNAFDAVTVRQTKEKFSSSVLRNRLPQTVSRLIVKSSAKRARSAAERFVISANDAARF